MMIFVIFLVLQTLCYDCYDHLVLNMFWGLFYHAYYNLHYSHVALVGALHSNRGFFIFSLLFP